MDEPENINLYDQIAQIRSGAVNEMTNGSKVFDQEDYDREMWFKMRQHRTSPSGENCMIDESIESIGAFYWSDEMKKYYEVDFSETPKKLSDQTACFLGKKNEKYYFCDRFLCKCYDFSWPLDEMNKDMLIYKDPYSGGMDFKNLKIFMEKYDHVIVPNESVIEYLNDMESFEQNVQNEIDYRYNIRKKDLDLLKRYQQTNSKVIKTVIKTGKYVKQAATNPFNMHPVFGALAMLGLSYHSFIVLFPVYEMKKPYGKQYFRKVFAKDWDKIRIITPEVDNKGFGLVTLPRDFEFNDLYNWAQINFSLA